MDKEDLVAFVSWSGGKESVLSFYKAKIAGVRIFYLLNMTREDGRFSRSHGLSYDVLRAQAESIGVPLILSQTCWEDYERNFKRKVLELKREGVNAGVFGDVDLREHREWVEKVCRDVGIKPILPLWGEDREKLLWRFIRTGFKAFVVAIHCDFLDYTWLGREVNEEFMKDLKSLGNVDLCGEKGEYHTFVFDGPIFKKKIKFTLGGKVLKDNYYFLEVKPI